MPATKTKPLHFSAGSWNTKITLNPDKKDKNKFWVNHKDRSKFGFVNVQIGDFDDMKPGDSVETILSSLPTVAGAFMSYQNKNPERPDCNLKLNSHKDVESLENLEVFSAEEAIRLERTDAKNVNAVMSADNWRTIKYIPDDGKKHAGETLIKMHYTIETGKLNKKGKPMDTVFVQAQLKKGDDGRIKFTKKPGHHSLMRISDAKCIHVCTMSSGNSNAGNIKCCEFYANEVMVFATDEQAKIARELQTNKPATINTGKYTPILDEDLMKDNNIVRLLSGDNPCPIAADMDVDQWEFVDKGEDGVFVNKAPGDVSKMHFQLGSFSDDPGATPTVGTFAAGYIKKDKAGNPVKKEDGTEFTEEDCKRFSMLAFVPPTDKANTEFGLSLNRWVLETGVNYGKLDNDGEAFKEDEKEDYIEKTLKCGKKKRFRPFLVSGPKWVPDDRNPNVTLSINKPGTKDETLFLRYEKDEVSKTVKIFRADREVTRCRGNPMIVVGNLGPPVYEDGESSKCPTYYTNVILVEATEEQWKSGSSGSVEVEESAEIDLGGFDVDEEEGDTDMGMDGDKDDTFEVVQANGGAGDAVNEDENEEVN